MTLEELGQRVENEGFRYAYGSFLTEQQPPYLISLTQSSNNFMADNKVYLKKNEVALEYYYKIKDFDEQNKIEDIILKDVSWEKSEEVYLQDEKVWYVIYYFEVINN